jgi:hypothetical protein
MPEAGEGEEGGIVTRYPGNRINRPVREEDDLQKAEVVFLEVLRQQGRLEYVATPNEAKRSYALAEHMRQMGLRTGFPDLTILWRTPAGAGVPSIHRMPQTGYIENKSKNGVIQPSQRDWAGWLTDNGHRYALVRDFGQFKQTLYTWGLISAREMG